MNKIQYSREEILKDYFDCSNLQAVLAKICIGLEEKGNVICSLNINNKDISAEEQVNLPFELEDVSFLAIEYCTQEEFFVEFLESTARFVHDVIEICPHMVQAISDANYQDFHKMFSEFADSMDAVITALYYIHKTNSDIIAETKWQTQEKRLSAVLQQMLDAYVDRDYVLLADLIEYEMMDDLKSWYQIIKRFSGDETSEKQRGIEC